MTYYIINDPIIVLITSYYSANIINIIKELNGINKKYTNTNNEV